MVKRAKNQATPYQQQLAAQGIGHITKGGAYRSPAKEQNDKLWSRPNSVKRRNVSQGKSNKLLNQHARQKIQEKNNAQGIPNYAQQLSSIRSRLASRAENFRKLAQSAESNRYLRQRYMQSYEALKKEQERFKVKNLTQAKKGSETYNATLEEQVRKGNLRISDIDIQKKIKGGIGKSWGEVLLKHSWGKIMQLTYGQEGQEGAIWHAGMTRSDIESAIYRYVGDKLGIANLVEPEDVLMYFEELYSDILDGNLVSEVLLDIPDAEKYQNTVSALAEHLSKRGEQ